MADLVDWEQLARQIGSLHAEGESGGSDFALRAIEILLGEDRLRGAVDYYVSGRPGSELARSVLWQLHPWSAMQRCYEVYRSEADVIRRCMAVELLRVVADSRALRWIGEFLDDPHADIQVCGAGVLDQLLWSSLVRPEQCEDLLKKAREHQNVCVRETATFIAGYLVRRDQTLVGSPRVDETGA